MGPDTEQSVVFLAAHLGSLNAAATSGLFRPIHDLLDLNGVGGARDKELVPHYNARTPVSPSAPKSQVYVYVCRTLYHVPPAGSIGDKSIPFTSETSFNGLVLSLINGFRPKYQHFHRPRLTRPFHRLSSTMPCLLAG